MSTYRGGEHTQSLLINGCFRVNQRTVSLLTPALADDSPALDRWYLLSQSNPINALQVLDVETGAATGMEVYQPNVTAQRMGFAQIVESDDTRPLRGSMVTLSGRLLLGGTTGLHVAILEWTGTKDVVTSDVVLDWTSTNYTPGNFFITGLNVIAHADLATVLNVWRHVDATGVTKGAGLTATVGNTANNLIVFVWSTAVLAQGVVIEASRFKLEKGGKRSGWNPRPLGEELALCQRYYRKSFPLATAPAQNAGVAGAIQYNAHSVAAGRVDGTNLQFGVPMRVAPTLTFFNPTNTNANWRNTTDGADSGAAALSGTASEYGAYIQNTQVAGDDPGDILRVHYTADAEL